MFLVFELFVDLCFLDIFNCVSVHSRLVGVHGITSVGHNEHRVLFKLQFLKCGRSHHWSIVKWHTGFSMEQKKLMNFQLGRRRCVVKPFDWLDRWVHGPLSCKKRFCVTDWNSWLCEPNCTLFEIWLVEQTRIHGCPLGVDHSGLVTWSQKGGRLVVRRQENVEYTLCIHEPRYDIPSWHTVTVVTSCSLHRWCIWRAAFARSSLSVPRLRLIAAGRLLFRFCQIAKYDSESWRVLFRNYDLDRYGYCGGIRIDRSNFQEEP